MTKRYIKPKETQYKLVWDPEPYMGDTSMKPHENIEEPGARIILLARISKTQFERHAAFESGPGYKFLRDSSLWWVGDTILLASDQNDIDIGDDNIYTILEWKDCHFVFGRMLRSNVITKMCIKAFKELLSPNTKTPRRDDPIRGV